MTFASPSVTVSGDVGRGAFVKGCDLGGDPRRSRGALGIARLDWIDARKALLATLQRRLTRLTQRYRDQGAEAHVACASMGRVAEEPTAVDLAISPG